LFLAQKQGFAFLACFSGGELFFNKFSVIAANIVFSTTYKRKYFYKNPENRLT
jgi:hypothetical protein